MQHIYKLLVNIQIFVDLLHQHPIFIVLLIISLGFIFYKFLHEADLVLNLELNFKGQRPLWA